MIAHIKRWIEIYTLPLVLALLAGIVLFVGIFQRPVFDLGELIDILVLTFKALVLLSVTTITQKAVFGWRSETHTDLTSDIYDACVSAFLLLFWLYVFFIR